MNLSSITSIFTGNPWVYAAAFAAGAVVAGGVTYEVTAAFKDNTIKDMQIVSKDRDLTDARGLLKQFADDSNRIHGAAESFGKTKTDLDNQFAKISKDFANAIKAHPLPVGCAPDAVRLLNLAAAVAAANRARTAGQQSIPAVPAHP
jgi:hypothetical protein